MASTPFKIGSPVTVTIDLNVGFQPSDAKVRSIANKLWPIFLVIKKVTRNLGSSNYVITFTARTAKNASWWSNLFEETFELAGYDDATVVDVSGGLVSRDPGGLLEATKGAIGETLSIPAITDTMSTIKWAAAGLMALMVIIYLPKPRRAR